MKYNQIRDKSNRLIATTQEVGDMEIVRDKGNSFLGQYNKISDRTTDKSGKFFGRGNQLLRLVD